MDPPACTKNQIPVAEKREDAGVTTMHGAQAKTYSGLTLDVVLKQKSPKSPQKAENGPICLKKAMGSSTR